MHSHFYSFSLIRSEYICHSSYCTVWSYGIWHSSAVGSCRIYWVVMIWVAQYPAWWIVKWCFMEFCSWGFITVSVQGRIKYFDEKLHWCTGFCAARPPNVFSPFFSCNNYHFSTFWCNLFRIIVFLLTGKLWFFGTFSTLFIIFYNFWAYRIFRLLFMQDFLVPILS